MKRPAVSFSLLALAAAMIGAMILVCTKVNPKDLNKRQLTGVAVAILLGGAILPGAALIAVARESL